LRFYASDQVHNCHMKAMNLLGLGGRALVRIPTDAEFRMDPGALRAAIAADWAAGVKPACVIATADTTNTGAIDPLPDLADLCRDEGVWLHIDGCIGALIARRRATGIWSRGWSERIRWRLICTSGCRRPLMWAAS
jgi:aromatic-L-amino-acid/L-tryptophan decarboxylase